MTSVTFSRWFSHSLYSLLNRVAVLLFAFQNIFFMVRMMPKKEIGIWVLFTSITAILEMIRHGFIRNPFITHLVSAESPDEKTVITTSLVLHILVGIATSLILLIGAAPLSYFWDAPGLDTLFYLYALNNIVFIPFLHFEYLQTARSNFKAIFYSNLFRIAVPGLYIVVVYAFNLGITLKALAIVQILATATGSYVAYMYVKDFANVFSPVDWKLFRELFHFGKYTFGTNISSMFMKSTDTWMIGRFMTPASVALYNPALRISNLVEVPTLTISNVVFPHVPQKMKERGYDGVRDIYIKSVSIILAAMIPMVVPILLFSKEIIQLVFGPEYVEAAPILRVTIFYSLIIPFNRQFGTLMDGLKQPKLNFYLLVLVAGLNVIFNYFFLQWFGLIGSAYGTLLAYIVVFIFNQIILYKMYGINTFKVFESIFAWYKIGWDIFRKRIVKLA